MKIYYKQSETKGVLDFNNHLPCSYQSTTKTTNATDGQEVCAIALCTSKVCPEFDITGGGRRRGFVKRERGCKNMFAPSNLKMTFSSKNPFRVKGNIQGLISFIVGRGTLSLRVSSYSLLWPKPLCLVPNQLNPNAK